MRIAVTGGTGFVGRSVVNELLRRGHAVRVLARRPDDARSRFNQQVIAVAGDLADGPALASTFSGCDAIVHLVGIIHEKEGLSFDAVHRQGTENVVTAAKAAGARRLLHMSAMGASADVASEYGRTKAAGQDAARRSGLDATIFRPSVIFGPGDGFSTTLARVVRMSPLVVPVIGPGTIRFMPVSVREVARIFADSLEKPDTAGRTFEIGGPETLTLNEIHRAIAAVLGHPGKPLVHLPVWYGRILAALMSVLPEPPLTLDQLKSLARDNVGDVGPTAEVFGAPAVKFSDGIREYLRPPSRRDSRIGI